MKGIKKLDNILDMFLSNLATILYYLLIVVVLIQIVARYNDNLALIWTEELSRLCFVYIIVLSAPLSLKFNLFADVDILYVKFSKKVQKICYLINHILLTIFNILLLSSAYKFFLLGKRVKSPAMRWPMWIHHGTMIVLALFSLIYCVVKIIYFLNDQDSAIATLAGAEQGGKDE